jgi:hypothetical protein
LGDGVLSPLVEASEVMAAYAAAWEDGDPERAWSFHAMTSSCGCPGVVLLRANIEGGRR